MRLLLLTRIDSILVWFPIHVLNLFSSLYRFSCSCSRSLAAYGSIRRSTSAFRGVAESCPYFSFSSAFISSSWSLQNVMIWFLACQLGYSSFLRKLSQLLFLNGLFSSCLWYAPSRCFILSSLPYLSSLRNESASVGSTQRSRVIVRCRISGVSLGKLRLASSSASGAVTSSDSLGISQFDVLQ